MGDRHRSAMHKSQLNIVEGLKWGQYYLVKFPEGPPDPTKVILLRSLVVVATIIAAEDRLGAPSSLEPAEQRWAYHGEYKLPEV